MVKNFLGVSALLFMMGWISSCSEPAGTVRGEFTLQVDDESKGSVTYRGRSVKAWVNLSKGKWPQDEVHWRTGRGTVIRRSSVLEKSDQPDGGLLSDTVWVDWYDLPPLALDTIEVDSVTNRVDSSFVDTLSVVVDGVESDVVSVQVLNIIPQIDTVTVGSWSYGLEDSVILLSAHYGELVDFSFNLSDPYNLDNRPSFIMPEGQGITEISVGDSLARFRWQAPEQAVNDTFDLELRDTGGFGVRLYRIHLLTYQESGSVWVGASKDLVKISSEGEEVIRLRNVLTEASGLTINPNRNQVWVTDRGAGNFLRYSTDGGLVGLDSTTFSRPQAVAVDVQSGFLWVSDMGTLNQGQIRKFDPGSGDSLSLVATLVGETGPVSSLSIDQYENDRLWYAVPERDYIGLALDGAQDTVFSNLGFNRPEFLAWDATSSRLWVGDSSSLRLLDSTGQVEATVSGFERIGGVSAGGGSVCVSDVRSGEIVRFSSTLSGNHSVEDGVVTAGFVSPTATAIYLVDGSCWVTDTEAGVLVQVSSSGSELLRVGGLNQPSILAVHQGVE